MTVKYFTQAEELGNRARELKGLIDDSESVIFINLDRYVQIGYTLCIHAHYRLMFLRSNKLKTLIMRLNKPLFLKIEFDLIQSPPPQKKCFAIYNLTRKIKFTKN